MIEFMHIIGICPDAIGHADLIDTYINIKANNITLPSWNLKSYWIYLKTIF